MNNKPIIDASPKAIHARGLLKQMSFSKKKKTLPEDIEKFMPEARQLAAQCWCDDDTKSIEMDSKLAEAVARRLAAWMSTAAHFSDGLEFYRDLLSRCGKAFGDKAKIRDDGSKSKDILALKVPELVEELCHRMESLEK